MTQQTKQSWPKNAMVGYIDTTAPGSMAAITTAQIQSYNVVIFGFANSDGTLGQDVKRAIADTQEKQANGTLNLISVGGANGTLSLTEETIDHLLKTLADNQLDGVDLDLEDPTIDMDALATFVDKLKDKLAQKYLLVMAPILAGELEKPTLNIPDGGPSLAAIYSRVAFDAILVQAYNSGLSHQYPLPSDPAKWVGENSPNIISAAYNALQKYADIHPQSKIVIGIASNAGGAPTASNLWNTEDIDAIPGAISANLSAILQGQHQINPSQFGGLMAWSLNTDANPSSYPPFANFTNSPAGYFAENVAPLLESLG
jgi:chitinase